MAHERQLSVLTCVFVLSVASEGDTLAAKQNPAHKAMMLHEHIKVCHGFPPGTGILITDFFPYAGLSVRHFFCRGCHPTRHCRNLWIVPRIGHRHRIGMRYQTGERSSELRHPGESHAYNSVIRAQGHRIIVQEVNVGLAADIGTLQRFPKITGSSSLARELAMTGRRFSPAEATAIGFTSRVVPGGRDGVIGEAIEMAKVIASKSPVAVTSTKRLMIRE